MLESYRNCTKRIWRKWRVPDLYHVHKVISPTPKPRYFYSYMGIKICNDVSYIRTTLYNKKETTNIKMAETKCTNCDCDQNFQDGPLATPGPPKLELFEVDRPIENTTAIIWMAATDAKQVKFDTVSSGTKVTKSEINNLEGTRYVFEDRILCTNDLLYGIRFTVPVTNFKLYLKQREGEKTQTIVNLSDPIKSFGIKRGIKSVSFKNPIPLYHNYYVYISYTFQSGEDISAKFDDTTIYTDYKVLNPCFTLGILQDRYRSRDIIEFNIECNVLYIDGMLLSSGTNVNTKWYDSL